MMVKIKKTFVLKTSLALISLISVLFLFQSTPYVGPKLAPTPIRPKLSLTAYVRPKLARVHLHTQEELSLINNLLIGESKLCHQEQYENSSVLIIIKSSSVNFKQRELIRR